MIPRATYRLQFHSGFTFADAEKRVPYLDALGISHIYASPITTARKGSSHGYDVVDPTRINPELGGEAGFADLVAALRARGMGLVLDIVPNHMGVGPENPWWMDVLTHGPDSAYAHVFDIDWSRHDGRMLLPFLGTSLQDALANGDLALATDSSGQRVIRAYGETDFPLRPDSPQTDDLATLLDAQHYRLAWWRSGHDELNWRRFFSVTELAGLRIEDDAVFELTHELYFRLYRDRLIDGLRVDHVDGLTDPVGYCRKLRTRMAELREGPGWLIVEKILGPGEPLPRDWPVDGTSGYEFMNAVSALLHERNGDAALSENWHAVSGRPALFAPEEGLARRQMLDWEFTGQFESCVAAFYRLAQSAPETRAYTRAMIARANRALLEIFPVYRTYGTGKFAPPSDERTRRITRERVAQIAAPGEMPVIDAILSWLAGTGPGDAADAVRQFQQLSAPIAAKSVEDTAFYRYGRLLSRNDVGFDIEQFSMLVDDFHAANSERLAHFPRAMLTTATHDHKRGEDVRARLAVFSARTQDWIWASGQWLKQAHAAVEGLDSGDLYMLFQMLVGAWPEDDSELPDFAPRLAQWQEKAVREAKLRSSWVEPNTEYESRLKTFIDWLLLEPAGSQLRQEIAQIVGAIEPDAIRNGLVQTVLRYTLPGIPDLYQGTEFRDFSLVDPDNRRPVDYEARIAALKARSNPKQATIADLLALRRAHPLLFAQGDYIAIPAGEHRIAFARIHGDLVLLCVLPLHGKTAGLGQTPILLPPALAERLGHPSLDDDHLLALSSAAPAAREHGLFVSLLGA